jgi:hypothetical protein
MDVTVVVATFGDAWWQDLAERRAVPSASGQGVPIFHVHGDTLHGARNAGLGMVGTEWVCFVDADDELEPGFFDAMGAGSADLRAPAVAYVRPNGAAQAPYVPRVSGHHHDCTAGCLSEGNWLVVGTVARTDLVRQVGGWHDWPMFEDWDLWLRCWQAGGTVEAVPAAVYRAHVRPDSRNRAPSPSQRMEAHRAIAEARGVPVP